MTNLRVVLVVGIVVGLVVYGGLVGFEAVANGSLFGGATDSTASIGGTTYHLDRAGQPTVVGEVTNGFGDPITNVSVTVTFLSDGRRVSQVTDRTLRETIPAGERAPFDIHMASADPVDDYEVTLNYEQGGETDSELTVTDTTVVREAQDQTDVVGTIENTGNRPLVASRVVATFYDDNGSVIGARLVRPDRTVAPGESTTLRVTFRTLGDVPSYAREFESFELSVEQRDTDQRSDATAQRSSVDTGGVTVARPNGVSGVGAGNSLCLRASERNSEREGESEIRPPSAHSAVTPHRVAPA